MSVEIDEKQAQTEDCMVRLISLAAHAGLGQKGTEPTSSELYSNGISTSTKDRIKGAPCARGVGTGLIYDTSTYLENL